MAKKRRENLLGKVFGMWKVIDEAERENNRTYWFCECECGTRRRVNAYALKKGKSKNCGCVRDRKHLKHGHNRVGKRTTEYVIWSRMIDRCHKVNHNKYKDYGARGIKVCSRWLDFKNFLEDMGKRPSKKHTLDRIDYNGNYEPQNCRWATYSEQNRNQRIRSTNKTGITGVWKNKRGSYEANIGINYKQIKLGVFNNLEEAKEARKQAELKYWGKSSL